MLTARYKRYAKGGMYAAGGDMDLAMGLGQGAAIMGSLVDAWNKPNRYGRQGMAGNMLSSAGNLAAAGSVFGPWGTAIGGGVGLAAGLVKSLGQNKAQNRAEAQEAFSNQQQEQQKAQVALAGDPTLLTGNRGASYYAKGGHLKKHGQGYTEMQSQAPYNGSGYQPYAAGGNMKPLSSTAVDVQGPSHAEGGVDIPGVQAEVEGGETINGNYVFSKQLGFAQIHRPIAKAIGKIEQKAMSPERINSLKFLKETEHRLQLSQEFVRNLHNTQQHA